MIKLLVVDDEVDICDFVRKFFSERNFEVLVAYNGKEAVDIVKAEKPAIALLDIKMPIMDGMEAVKAIRKIDEDIKLIMVTALDDIDRAEEAKKHGVLEYITKPLLLEQLERIVLTVSKEIKMGSNP
ncbi:MAG: response regulator [Candidatus Omnitrophota bacterium]